MVGVFGVVDGEEDGEGGGLVSSNANLTCLTRGPPPPVFMTRGISFTRDGSLGVADMTSSSSITLFLSSRQVGINNLNRYIRKLQYRALHRRSTLDCSRHAESHSVDDSQRDCIFGEVVLPEPILTPLNKGSCCSGYSDASGLVAHALCLHDNAHM
jgi:hypothetical protein